MFPPLLLASICLWTILYYVISTTPSIHKPISWLRDSLLLFDNENAVFPFLLVCSRGIFTECKPATSNSMATQQTSESELKQQMNQLIDAEAADTIPINKILSTLDD